MAIALNKKMSTKCYHNSLQNSASKNTKRYDFKTDRKETKNKSYKIFSQEQHKRSQQSHQSTINFGISTQSMSTYNSELKFVLTIK